MMAMAQLVISLAGRVAYNFASRVLQLQVDQLFDTANVRYGNSSIFFDLEINWLQLERLEAFAPFVLAFLWIAFGEANFYLLSLPLLVFDGVEIDRTLIFPSIVV
jgi:hypothetical protein